jgi:hypothetical protein
MSETYTLEVTEKQLQVISQACELLSRTQIGQWMEAFRLLPKSPHASWETVHAISDAIKRLMPSILEGGIDGAHSSLGIGHPALPESQAVSWDLHQSIRHCLAWDNAVKEGLVESVDSPRKWPEMLGVAYDSPYKIGNEPLVEIRKNSNDA